MRGAVVALSLVLAGCSGTVLRESSGRASHTFVFSPDPACVASERAPLEGLGDLRTLLTDAITERGTRTLLQRMTGGRPCELETVAPTTTGLEAYLKRPPEDPCPAALRLVPEKLEITPAAGSVRLRVDYMWGQACVVPRELADEPLLEGDRERAFSLALEEFLERRLRGWRLDANGNHESLVDAEIVYGRKLWGK